jgi:hypothetical protein
MTSETVRCSQGHRPALDGQSGRLSVSGFASY